MRHSGLQIRAWQPGDEASIMHSFNAVFRQNRDEAYWRWKYLHDGRALAWLCVNQAGAVLSQIAAHPVRWAGIAGSWQVGHAGDVFTLRSPDAVHGQAMLKTLAAFHRSQRESRDVRLLFGFPSDTLRGLHGTRRNLLGPERPVRRYCHTPQQQKTDSCVREDLPTNTELDALWARCSSRYPLACPRDAAWVNWRFNARPDVRDYHYAHIRDSAGRPQAWAVLRILDGGLWIADLLWDGVDRQALSALLAYTRDLACQRQCHGAALWLEGDEEAREVLLAGGWRDDSHAHGAKLFLHGYDANLDYDWIRDTLYLTKGDSDLI